MSIICATFPHPLGSGVRHVTGGPKMLVVDLDVEGNSVVTAWKNADRVLEQRFSPHELAPVMWP